MQKVPKRKSLGHLGANVLLFASSGRRERKKATHTNVLS